MGKSTNINATPIPENEKKHIKELKSFNILNSLPEKEFDALTSLATPLCDVPISLINFIDTRKQFTKSCIGISVEHIPREQSICQYTILVTKYLQLMTLAKIKDLKTCLM